MINRGYRLKELLECPAIYLCADISKYDVSGEVTGKNCWAMSADSHVKKALEVVQRRMREYGVMFKHLNNTAENPIFKSIIQARA